MMTSSEDCPRWSLAIAVGSVVALLAICLAVEPTAAYAGSGRSASSSSGAGTMGRSKGLEAAEGDFGGWSAPSSAARPSTGMPKSGQGGYSPQRVQRFWSHYHSSRRPPKRKPLERTH